MMSVSVLVLTGYGLNCDHETAHAFSLAGARAERVHIKSLVTRERVLSGFDILAFVGGFSWGDDHGAGVLAAVKMGSALGEDLARFVEGGGLVIGICNGFQILVNLGLLPGFDGDYRSRRVALINNDSGRFRDDWVHVSANPASPCAWTRGLSTLELPVRHGEGKFTAGEEDIKRLTAQGQDALYYSFPDGSRAGGKFPENPNGSVLDIAGVCDPTGRVFGLMPHPEAYHHFTNHPNWTRAREAEKRLGLPPSEGLAPGVQLLKNGVDRARENRG